MRTWSIEKILTIVLTLILLVTIISIVSYVIKSETSESIEVKQKIRLRYEYWYEVKSVNLVEYMLYVIVDV